MDADSPAIRSNRVAADSGGFRTRAAQLTIAGIRVVMMIAVLSAVTATFANTAENGPVNPFNFFGYFTIQSNLLGAAVFGVTAVVGFRGRPQGVPLQIARAAVTTYLLVVGLVYNTLLSGLAGGVDVSWANTVMHIVFPLYCLLDWLIVPDRSALPFRYLWAIEAYPVLWCAVILVRGATDGWVPYPFLAPSTGYGSVLLYVAAIAATFVLIGAAVLALSRLRLLRSVASGGGAQVSDVTG